MWHAGQPYSSSDNNDGPDLTAIAARVPGSMVEVAQLPIKTARNNRLTGARKHQTASPDADERIAGADPEAPCKYMAYTSALRRYHMIALGPMYVLRCYSDPSGQQTSS